MCGIFGIFSFNGEPIDRERLIAVTRLIAHRGPDGEGYECINGVGLGHRRLSIIDLNQGAQPMRSGDGNTVVTFNGEIFNYIELKLELEREGVQFRTSSDTEVLLEGFSRYGPDFFSRLNGQFAAAFYNIKSKMLHIVRDRLGEKPIFYYVTPDEIIFGSELKVIIAWANAHRLPLEFDYEAFGHYLSLNYVPFSKTLIKGVLALEPGSYLTVRGRSLSSKPYWQPTQGAPFASESEALEEFSAVLRNAVQIRLRSDVPVGMFLSGGLDSSTILHAVSQQAARVTAYIAHFHEASFSEVPQAQRVCEKLSIPYHIVDITPGAENIPDLFEKLVYHGDTPLADSSALPVTLLSRETAKHVKVVLSGDGGDEFFGGYLTYIATLLSAAIPQSLRKLIHSTGFFLALMPASNRKVGLLEKLDRFLRASTLPPGAAHFAWNGMFMQAEKAKLLHREIINKYECADTFEVLCKYFAIDRLSPTVSQLMRADERCYLSEDILTKVDRMTMMHGLEARPVFLDHRFAELSRRLPPALIMRRFKGKVVLREYLRSYAPWYALNAKKQGFSIPVHLWMRTVLKDFAGELLNSEFARTSGLFNHDYLMKLWNEHQTRKRNLGFELWGVLVVLSWARRFLRFGR